RRPCDEQNLVVLTLAAVEQRSVVRGARALLASVEANRSAPAAQGLEQPVGNTVHRKAGLKRDQRDRGGQRLARNRQTPTQPELAAERAGQRERELRLRVQ